MTASRTAWTAVAAVAAFTAVTAPVARAQTVGHQESYTWVSIDQRTCLDRAQAALEDVNDRTRVNARVQTREGWYAMLEGNGLYVGVHCVADDNSSSLTSSFARRMMVSVQVASSRGDLRGAEGNIRAEVTDCLRTGSCLNNRRGNGGGGFGGRDGRDGRDDRDNRGGGFGQNNQNNQNNQGNQGNQGGRAGRCGWVNAQDRSLGADAGRGVTDPAGHRAYALQGGAQTTPGFVRDRLQALRGCLSPGNYSTLYGDVSVTIAAVGRANLGWPDGTDNSNPSDTGRGVSNVQSHRDYAARGGAPTTPDAVAARLQTLASRVRPDVYAQVYADISVIMARAGVLN